MWPVMNASSLFQQELCFLLFSGNNNDFILCSGFTLHYGIVVVTTTNNDLQSKQQLTKSNKETLEMIF